MIISLCVPLVLSIGAPLLIHHSSSTAQQQRERRYRWLLYLACGLFFVSWYLPSPLIHGQDTSFTTHLVGGGMFTGCLWLYLGYTYRLRMAWATQLASLFMMVSALGCLNELGELLAVELGLVHLTLTDTSWDIAANSLGALIVWVFYTTLTRANLAPPHSGGRA